MSDSPDNVLDLLVVGAGPTGLAIGAAAGLAGVDYLLLDRGGLTQAILEFPEFMQFFTTRELLEIADVPFTIPDDKPDRRQALAYYRAVASHHSIRFALHEEVVEVSGDRSSGFEVTTLTGGARALRRSRAVAFATGYFGNPRRLDVPGQDLPWVTQRYSEPYRYFGQHVVIVGGGNSAAEAALELYRAGVQVTVIVRGSAMKPTLKYWVKPDFENRVAEGSIAARYSSAVVGFESGVVEIEGSSGRERLSADAALVLIGYTPEVELMRSTGIRFDPDTLVPTVDSETCESNVPGLYVAGTLQAGRDTGRIFIENSRDHGVKIVGHLSSRQLLR